MEIEVKIVVPMPGSANDYWIGFFRFLHYTDISTYLGGVEYNKI